MTGPEHYREAEADLGSAARASDQGRQDDMTYWLGCAQVHATLALTAAAVTEALPMMKPADHHQWQTAIDPEYAAEQDAEEAR